jgi:hypothetical protein
VTDHSAERVARNDDIFRQANEQIRLAAGAHKFEAPIPFLCECADERCTEIVRLTSAEYAEIRSNPRRFLTAPGHHEQGDGHARVVARDEEYETTEKIGEAGEIAEELAE